MKTREIVERVQKVIATNRRAEHDYEIVQRIETGIILQGTEVKSLRQGKCSIVDAYGTFPNPNTNELVLVNFHISPYEHGNRENHEPKRPRKLLVKYREAIKLKSAVQEKGITLIPMLVYFSGPYVKIELGLARSKRKYDKREATKERETDREIRRKYRI